MRKEVLRKRELTDDHERPAAFPCSLQISQEVSIATLSKDLKLNFAFSKEQIASKQSYLSVQFANLLSAEMICVFIGC